MTSKSLTSRFPRICVFLLTAATGVVAIPSMAQNCNFYVSPSGNDTTALALTATPNMFSSSSNAFTTLQNAENYLSAHATTLGVGVYPMTVCAYSGTYTAVDATPANIAGSKSVNRYNPANGLGGTGGDVLDIQGLYGTAAAPVTFTAVAGNTPTIIQTGWAGIQVLWNTSYIYITNFTVYGITNDAGNKVDYTAAVTDRYSSAPNNNPAPWPYYDGNCIAVKGDPQDSINSSTPYLYIDDSTGTTYYWPGISQLSQIPSHIYIENNSIFGCGGGGISVELADYVSIIDNVVSNCAHYSIYGTSGISILDSVNSDGNTDISAGHYKNFVIGNRSFGNYELVPWEGAYPSPAITDGEGIIIDTNQNTSYIAQSSPNQAILVKLPAYLGRTLVADNVITENGGPAIETVSSAHVDILNNSTWGNLQTFTSFPTPPSSPAASHFFKGELFAVYSADVNAADNIFFATQPPDTSSPSVLPSPYGGGYNSIVNNNAIYLENNVFYAGGASYTAVTAADPSGNTWANGNYGSVPPWYVSSTPAGTWNTQANLQQWAGAPSLEDGSGDAFQTVDNTTDINGNPLRQSNGTFAVGAFAAGAPTN